MLHEETLAAQQANREAYLQFSIHPAATEDVEITNHTNTRQPTPPEDQPTDTIYQPLPSQPNKCQQPSHPPQPLPSSQESHQDHRKMTKTDTKQPSLAPSTVPSTSLLPPDPPTREEEKFPLGLTFTTITKITKKTCMLTSLQKLTSLFLAPTTLTLPAPCGP